MTHERPYKKTLTREEALEELKRCSGRQFDPHLVDVFVAWSDKAALAVT
jgi:HD-GYP domain-containing protein (c-di-GMP phosphodiesterase class II)